MSAPRSDRPNLLLAYLAALAVVVAFPFFAVLTSARTVISADPLYLWGATSLGVDRVTGLDQDQILEVSRDVRQYFTDDRVRLEPVAVVDGRRVVLFNEREILHMEDVKELIGFVYTIQTIATVVVLGVGLLAWVKRGYRRPAAIGFLFGAGLTLVIGLLAVVVATIDFSSAFLVFHLVSFDNDLWLLDPRTDRLIQLYPQVFFLVAAVAIAILAILICLVTILVSVRTLRRPDPVWTRKEPVSPAS